MNSATTTATAAAAATAPSPNAGLDPLFAALLLRRLRRASDCVDVCTSLLDKNPYDEAVWSLKTRALTDQVMVDDSEADEEGIVDMVLDDNAIRQVN